MTKDSIDKAYNFYDGQLYALKHANEIGSAYEWESRYKFLTEMLEIVNYVKEHWEGYND